MRVARGLGGWGLYCGKAEPLEVACSLIVAPIFRPSRLRHTNLVLQMMVSMSQAQNIIQQRYFYSSLIVRVQVPLQLEKHFAREV